MDRPAPRLDTALAPPAVPLRPPETVMRLARLGAAHPTRLSFAPTLLRQIEREGWRVSRPIWGLDAEGYGHAVYRVDTPRRTLSLIAFSTPLDPARRTDRVIAEAWDTSYALVEGVPDEAAIRRLAASVPLQEAGRFSPAELVLSRANKSVRLFEQLVECLASGRQPEPADIEAVGYLMRTTAVYGNGKFGIADRDRLADWPETSGPFRAEMLTVWLIRAFTVDLLDHCAAARAPGRAVRLDRRLARRLGVGNATGLGMAPFLVRHPLLLHRWILARETALARVRSLPVADAGSRAAFRAALGTARAELAGWVTDDTVQAGRIAGLGTDLERLAAAEEGLGDANRPWDRLYRWAETALGLEAQERLVSLLLEPHGALVDDLTQEMAADEGVGHGLDGAMSCGTLRAILNDRYSWALALDFEDPRREARFWYVSAEKLEPRLGERAEEPGAERELPLAVARDVARLARALAETAPDRSCAALAAERPDLRHVVRRVQLATRYPYAEIRDNLVDADMRPIDLLRCKLAFFGAARFDPRSDRWLRITLFQDAPFPDELAPARAAA